MKPSAEMPPEISVIIVNYGTADLVRMAVDSVLARDHGGRSVDIHLVDNASPGDDRAILAEACQSAAWAPHVTFYPETENHGFARGNNVALTALAAWENPPDKVFLLNPDARLDNEAIAILADRMDATPAMGFAGAAILQPDSGPVVAAFRFPGRISEFAQTIGLGFVWRLLQRWDTALPPDHPEGPVDWVSGAGVMARFDVLKALQFFDGGFFLYFEEVDLMRRGAVAGWQTWYVPDARIIHDEGVATGVKGGNEKRRRKPAYWYASWARYMQKAQGRGGAILTALTVLSAASVHHLLAALRGRQPSVPLRFLSDFWSAAARPLFAGSADKERP